MLPVDPVLLFRLEHLQQLAVQLLGAALDPGSGDDELTLVEGDKAAGWAVLPRDERVGLQQWQIFRSLTPAASIHAHVCHLCTWRMVQCQCK